MCSGVEIDRLSCGEETKAQNDQNPVVEEKNVVEGCFGGEVESVLSGKDIIATNPIVEESNVEDCFGGEMISETNFVCNDIENEFKVEIGQDFGIGSEIIITESVFEELIIINDNDTSLYEAVTVESGEDNIQDVVGDVSFDGCVS